ncbi:MAG: S46 family peptidase, partial [Flavobacteriales bacterium]
MNPTSFLSALSAALFALVLTLSPISTRATEGMWIPALLQAVEGDMQDMGLKLTAEDIYSINEGSLKDAIVHFNGGCTAEMVSGEGLLLTNHHCGYGEIAYHSTVENDYLTDGFWVMTRAEELANPNLVATFIDRIEDVTEIVRGAEDADAAKADLVAQATDGTGLDAEVVAFDFGNS